MTNEEIEKRFEFDLNMGLFTKSIRYPCEIYFKRSRKSYKLLRILLNIGFKLDPFLTGRNDDDWLRMVLEDTVKGYVCIDMYNSTVDVGLNWRFLHKVTQTFDFNSIPNYVRGYEIDDKSGN